MSEFKLIKLMFVYLFISFIFHQKKLLFPCKVL